MTINLTERMTIGKIYLMLSSSSWSCSPSSLALRIWIINFLMKTAPEHCCKMIRADIRRSGLKTVGENIGIFSLSKFSLSQDFMGFLFASKLISLLILCLKYKVLYTDMKYYITTHLSWKIGLSLAKNIPIRPITGKTAQTSDTRVRPKERKHNIPIKSKMQPTFLLAI